METYEDRDRVLRDFGVRIRDLRMERGLTQQELGKIIGMNRSYISEVENGNRNISFKSVIKVAHGLGVTLSAITDGVDEVPLD